MTHHDEINGRSECKEPSFSSVSLSTRGKCDLVSPLESSSSNIFSPSSDISVPWQSESKRSRFSSSNKFLRATPVDNMVLCMCSVASAACLHHRSLWSSEITAWLVTFKVRVFHHDCRFVYNADVIKGTMVNDFFRGPEDKNYEIWWLRWRWRLVDCFLYLLVRSCRPIHI